MNQLQDLLSEHLYKQGVCSDMGQVGVVIQEFKTG